MFSNFFWEGEIGRKLLFFVNCGLVIVNVWKEIVNIKFVEDKGSFGFDICGLF